MADEAALSLQNLGLLNRQFADAVSPINNFASQNMQLAVAQERARQEQANKVALQQQMLDAERQRQEAQISAQYGVARLQEAGAQDRGLGIAKFQAAHEDAVRLKSQADAIRGNPQARRVPGLSISKYADTPEGNAKLIADFTSSTSDPKVLQSMDVQEAKGINTNISTILKKLGATSPGSEQGKAATLAFLSTPGISDLLIKKGRLSPQELNDIAVSGDSSKVVAAIAKTADKAYTPWGDRDYLSQLFPAWYQALATAGVKTSPDQMVDATNLKFLLDARDKVFSRGNMYDGSAFSEALGEVAPTQTKLPPPPAAGLGTTNPLTRPTAQPNLNPFVQPTPPPPTGKIGLGTLLQTSQQTGINQLANTVDSGDRLSAAFSPQKYASDPYTEYAVRQQLLERERVHSSWKGALSAMNPFTSVATPQAYTAFNQISDEAKLQDVVKGLYAPTNTITPTDYRQFMPQAPIGVPQIRILPDEPVPQINPFAVPEIRVRP